MLTCPACGRACDADARFCPDDGTPLAAPSALDALDGLVLDAPSVPRALAPVPARSGAALPVVVAVLATLVVVLIGAVVWTSGSHDSPAVIAAMAPPSETDETADEEVPVDPPPPAPDPGYTDVAWANSPGDGFLALRSAPSVRSGERLIKVPHGAQLSLGACLAPTTVGRSYGSWCPARYAGIDGWAFNAFVTYAG